MSIASTTQAEIIGHSIPSGRERIAAFLDREDVAAQFASRGVTAADAKARVAALTEAEAAELASGIDSAMAGGAADPFSLVLMAIGILYVGVVLVVAGVTQLAKAVAKGPTAPAPMPAD